MVFLWMRDVYLLASCVEDVEQTGLGINDHLLSVAVLNSGVVLVHKMVLDQLDRQGRLAHTTRC